MSEPTIAIKNMPDGGSPAKVALELTRYCIEQEGIEAFKERGSVLNLYTDCLRAALGVRPDS